jgi:predicted naringenin-chalcone synthase
MSLVPDSRGLLGLDPPLKQEHLSYRMHLDKNTGKKLGEYFTKGLGKALIERLHPDLSKPFPALGVHPGGPNILDNVSESLQLMGWDKNAMDSSYETLQSYGNLGAAAMLFVLANRLEHIEEPELITLAFGPGVTVEWAKLIRTEL